MTVSMFSNFPYLEGLNPDQAVAVNASLDEPVRVLAGAGTGKTKLIAHRFVKLVCDLKAQGIDHPEERILAVTFTDDAAQELRQRIDATLKQMNLSGLSENSSISTFHGFCLQLLKKHSNQLGLSENFQILEPVGARMVFNELIQGICQDAYADMEAVYGADFWGRYGLSDALTNSYFSVTSLQKSGVPQVLEMLERIPTLIQRIKATGLSPAEFLETALGQSQGLTHQLKNMPLLDPHTQEPFEEVRGYCVAWHQVLQPWASSGWDPLAIEKIEAISMESLRDKDYIKQIEFIKKPLQILTYNRSSKKYDLGSLETQDLEKATEIEKILAHWVSGIYALYLEKLREKQYVDFDGIIHGAIQLLSSDSALRQKYRDLYKAVIVDEFQDSNGSELKLLNLLVDPQLPCLTVVGDEKQSIYSFRFAQKENLHLAFHQTQPRAILLGVNYRSYPPILEIANKFTQEQMREGGQPAEKPLEPSPKNQGVKDPAPVVWITLGKSQDSASKLDTSTFEKLKNDKSKSQKPESLAAIRQREARLIAKEIQRLVSETTYRYKDIAVLVKQHQKTEILESVLSGMGIPSVRKKNLGFFNEPSIKNAMALLQVLNTPYASEGSLICTLQSRLAPSQLKRLMALKGQGSDTRKSLYHLLETLISEPQDSFMASFQEVGLPLEGVMALQSFITILSDLGKEVSKQPVYKLFRQLGDTIGFISPETPPAFQEKQQRQLDFFESLLLEIGSDPLAGKNLSKTLEALALYQSDSDLKLLNQGWDSDEDAVRLTTIHSSKGLEFPVVFVSYTEENRGRALEDSRLMFDPQYPGKAGFGLIYGMGALLGDVKKEVYKNIWYKPQLEAEAKRLFYVAITRAQERLYVIRAQQSPDWTRPVAAGYEHLVCWNEQDSPQEEGLPDPFFQRFYA
ncbi:MAG: ATP-dependent helicase [Cyanobacteria bacterium]|nr:ATP-dependent helicase [Cyanobacteriota bacterium]